MLAMLGILAISDSNQNALISTCALVITFILVLELILTFPPRILPTSDNSFQNSSLNSSAIQLNAPQD